MPEAVAHRIVTNPIVISKSFWTQIIEFTVTDGTVMSRDALFEFVAEFASRILELFKFVFSTRFQHPLAANLTVLIELPITRPVNLSNDLPKSFFCHNVELLNC